MSTRIPLTQGLEALVDDEDAELVAGSWHAHFSRGLWYARRSRRLPGTRKVAKEYMHRLILGFPEGQIDHRNGRTLDNRRENLRLVTGTQNQGNSRLRKDNTTGYKGVRVPVYRQSAGAPTRWVVVCKRRYLGTFYDPLDAAIAYDCAAIAEFGTHANLNFDALRYAVGEDLMTALERGVI